MSREQDSLQFVVYIFGVTRLYKYTEQTRGSRSVSGLKRTFGDCMSGHWSKVDKRINVYEWHAECALGHPKLHNQLWAGVMVEGGGRG